MKKISLIVFCLIVFTLPVSAATLSDALKQTYENNLELEYEKTSKNRKKKVRKSKEMQYLTTIFRPLL